MARCGGRDEDPLRHEELIVICTKLVEQVTEQAEKINVIEAQLADRVARISTLEARLATNERNFGMLKQVVRKLCDLRERVDTLDFSSTEARMAYNAERQTHNYMMYHRHNDDSGPDHVPDDYDM